MKKYKIFLIIVAIACSLVINSCTTTNIKISFDSDGGTVVETIEIKKDSTVAKPSDPSKEGYTFVGWYLEDKIYDFNIPFTEDTTLLAKWNINEYEVVFETNCDTKIETQKVKYNDKVIKPNDPSKDGFKFLGWYLKEKLFNFDNLVTEDLILTAKWEKDVQETKYKITYHYGDRIEEEFVSANEYFIEKEYVQADKEQIFDGWYTSDGILCDEETLITNDIEVYPNVYTNGLIISKNNVFDYLGDSLEVIIPKYYKGYVVDTINDEAFIDKKIVKVTLPDSIKEIKAKAFEGCMFLSQINLNEGLTIIGENAFNLCLILTDINLPTTLKTIGSFAFSFTNVDTVVFPENIELLDSYAFHACNNLQEVIFKGSTPCEIGSTPFTYLNSDLDVIYSDFPIWIENGNYEDYREDLYLRDYGSNVFPISKQGQYGYIKEGTTLLGYIKQDNEELIDLDIPNGITEIADFSFYGNVRIKTINLPEGFLKIGKYAFYNCTSISNIFMPTTLKEIDDFAFAGFFVGNNITRLYFPEGFERIGEGAFMSSFNLKYVEFPTTLNYIGYLAFGMANSLERMYFSSKEVPIVGTYVNDKEETICEIFSIVNSAKTIIYVPYGTNEDGEKIVDAYKNAAGFDNVVQYIKAKPEGKEVGHYGDGKLFIDLDGCDQATIYTLVEMEEDGTHFGGNKYEYQKTIGTYKLNGIRLEMSFENYGDIVAVYGNRQISFELDGTQYTLKEPKYYYDSYNWANFVLYDNNNEYGNGIFDMYGSFLTPFEWSINGDVFKIKIDGNNIEEEHSEYKGVVEYIGTYDISTDSFNVEFMLNDFEELMNFTAKKNNVIVSSGEDAKLYGTYKVYSDETKEFALYTFVSYANGVLDIYLDDALYENCSYKIENNIIKIDFQSLEIVLTMTKDGYLEGNLFNQNVIFEYVDEVMDSTKLPE